MNVTVKGDKLTIVMDLSVKGTPTKSEKNNNMLHATTRGNIDAGIQVGGKDLIVSVNAYTKA